MLNIHTKEEMLKTGIYKITCLKNLKFYIGSASAYKAQESKKGFYRRFQRHLFTLKNNKHSNKILQNSWNKYGQNQFKFEIIEFCIPELCREREQHYLNILQPFYPIGFNICKNSLNNIKTIVKSTNTQNRDLINLNSHLQKSILQFDLNGNFIKEWFGITKTSKILNIKRQNIYKCCRGTEKSAGGFIWKYKNPEFTITKQPKFNLKLINIEDNTFEIFQNFKNVCQKLNISISTARIYEKNNLLFNNKYKIEKIFL